MHIPACVGVFLVSSCAVIGAAEPEGRVNITATENAKALFSLSISESAGEEQLVPHELRNGAGCCPPVQVELHRQSQ